jgi:hypothetical protein
MLEASMNHSFVPSALLPTDTHSDACDVLQASSSARNIDFCIPASLATVTHHN